MDVGRGTRQAVYARDGHLCQAAAIGGGACSAEELPNLLTIHHVRPRSRGGTNTPGNLLTACVRHHRLIHADEPFAERLGLIDLSAPLQEVTNARLMMARRAANLTADQCRLYGLPYHVPNARKRRYRMVLAGEVTLPAPGPPAPPPVLAPTPRHVAPPPPPDPEWVDPETGIVYALSVRGARPVGVIRASDAATA